MIHTYIDDYIYTHTRIDDYIATYTHTRIYHLHANTHVHISDHERGGVDK